MSRYLIGIDLGTTNSALAYIDSRAKGPPAIVTFAIPQLIAPGEVMERPLLPSFLYLPGPHDLPVQACVLPWDDDRSYAVGEFARNHGARVPGRLVHSAKSWLCHSGVDRSAAILPWGSPPEVGRISAVEASARYLRHLAEAWNYRMARQDSEAEFGRQPVVLTVPASFDDVARNLTVEAARQAGIEHLTLLEEPQAAFYAWLAQDAMPGDKHATRRTSSLAGFKPGMVCVVIDVGGGTSDFSLIEAVEQQGELAFVRRAVGEHLLLGGDNMDLALARHVEGSLAGGRRLDAASFAMLTQACRTAKEVLLGPSPPESYSVTIVGRGRQVVGAAQHARLTPEEVRQVILDGFFPATAFDARPQRSVRTGLHEIGLPYVADPAIPKHLAEFLTQHGMDGDRPPEAVLFNGGVFQPASVRQRMLDVMTVWYSRPERSWQPLVLANPSLDLAVSCGAAYYGWLRQTGGRKIAGGLARSYYVQIETGEPPAGDAEPTIPLLCIVPQHLEEGESISLEQPQLELALGQPVSFPLYTSTVRGGDQAGEMLHLESRRLLRLPPLHTILRGGKRSGVKRIPITLETRLTAVGTLELFCVSQQNALRWRLEFNTRDLISPDEGDADEEMRGPAAITDVWQEDQVQAAAECIRRVYADSAEVPARELTRTLEAVLDSSRHNWPTGLCRRLWEFLAEVADRRKLSPAHLARWYHLAGWSLRPGFGDPLDRFRVDQLWKMVNAASRSASGPAMVSAPPARVLESGADYWIMWRRVAGGLIPSLQQSLFERVRPALVPAKGGKGVAFKPAANELAEIWRAVAAMERLDVAVKQMLGQVLLRQVRRSPAPTYAFWALTRLGARVLVYGPLNGVVHPQIVESWLEALCGFEPGNDNEQANWQFCLAQLCRRTGQRALDVGDEMRRRVAELLGQGRASAHLVKLVEEGGVLESAEEKQLLGDALPIGLRLAAGK